MIKYNVLSIDNYNFIRAKAKSKKDGVYTIRGIIYRVINATVTHYACNGEILENFGNFNVKIGSYSSRLEVTRRLKVLS